MATNFIWDVNQVNMQKPSDDLYQNGFPLVAPDWIETSANMNYLLNSITTNSVQTGDIDYYLGINAPDGWLLCNGNGISKTNTYPSATFYGEQYKDLFIFDFNI